MCVCVCARARARVGLSACLCVCVRARARAHTVCAGHRGMPGTSSDKHVCACVRRESRPVQDPPMSRRASARICTRVPVPSASSASYTQTGEPGAVASEAGFSMRPSPTIRQRSCPLATTSPATCGPAPDETFVSAYHCSNSASPPLPAAARRVPRRRALRQSCSRQHAAKRGSRRVWAAFTPQSICTLLHGEAGMWKQDPPLDSARRRSSLPTIVAQYSDRELQSLNLAEESRGPVRLVGRPVKRLRVAATIVQNKHDSRNHHHLCLV